MRLIARTNSRNCIDSVRFCKNFVRLPYGSLCGRSLPDGNRPIIGVIEAEKVFARAALIGIVAFGPEQKRALGLPGVSSA